MKRRGNLESLSYVVTIMLILPVTHNSGLLRRASSQRRLRGFFFCSFLLFIQFVFVPNLLSTVGEEDAVEVVVFVLDNLG